MIKRRNRPQPRVRESSPDTEQPSELEEDEEEDKSLPISELIELRKLKKSRQGIDVSKLSKGDAKKRKHKTAEDGEEAQGGLRAGARVDEEEAGTDAKARRAVRTSNFTQQTNVLDVDKHMMAYIEENLKIRSRPEDPSESKPGANAQDEFSLSERWKGEKKAADEGNVTNSMAMLTAIPEVDLGMDTRLKNIEETEKAKRQVAEVRKERKRSNDEEHLVATRFYRPHLKQKSDAEIMRDAKLEAMGLPPQEDRRPRGERPQMATDEVVMERFKKRMRR
ncbi:hepatocellular carcinoma-associated antigen 59-domain-containing protein [Suillus clintonianus]|uniref:hepatocellular carcinoma-associated antigen 59-domain-containing protein n=1 Tax=Suillus clintonianus TaxID=1904413 RepID=UPI001B8737A4|nr:hepatocellular carcinoma-associated antigen 59-domain-containing protein [Suillus clintonianus]KAG2128978.1 hepatocellular carcinoma-associated antigen 59-domain-containing protein [Suillus clintonianus]